MHKKNIVIIAVLFLAEVCLDVFLAGYLTVKSQNYTKKMENRIKIKQTIVSEMKYFPIPKQYYNRITFSDTYGDGRTQGQHEGCDIMDCYDTPNQIPVISCTDGVITNKGWLYLGGYRIGITSDNGNYYYYAHLAGFSPNLEIGDEVLAGQILGFMGNSGEGKEGTVGKFPTHLHFGIYNFKESDVGMNPYPYLKQMQ